MPTFDELQKSEYSGRPLELYKFSNNDRDFRYTSSTEETTYNDALYEPLEGIAREKIAQTTNLDKADLSVTLPVTADIVREYRKSPASSYWLTLFTLHFGETETKQLWQGRVIEVTRKGKLAELRLESVLTTLNRLGLQPGFGLLCRHYLYDGVGCPVQRSNHARPATVSAIDGDTLTTTGLGTYVDDWFRGGYVELADGDRRDVIHSEQATGDLILVRNFSAESLQVLDPVTAFDGCQHRWQEDCIGKFGGETNNGEAHGGFPFGGAKNPFKTGVT